MGEGCLTVERACSFWLVNISLSVFAFACITETQTKSSSSVSVAGSAGWRRRWGRRLGVTHRADRGKGVCRRGQRRVVQAQQDDGGINKDASHCGDVAQLGAGKFNCSVEREERQANKREMAKSESRVRCQVESALQAAAGTGLTATPTSVYLLELAKVQIEGEERDGQCDAHAGECGYGVEGQRSNGGHAQLEHTLRNGHLPTVPLDRTTARATEVEGICGRVVEGDGLQ